MGKTSGNDDRYSENEAAERFRAALKGARIAGHKPLESLTRKGKKTQSKKRRKTKVTRRAPTPE
jgi:hypothetical protein